MTFDTPSEPFGAYREPPQRRKTTNTVAWLVVACIFVALWAFIGAGVQLSDSDPEANAGYRLGVAVGNAFIASLVVWLVLYFAIVRQHDPKRGLRHYLILLATALAGSLTALLIVVPVIESRARIAEIDLAYQAEIVALDDAMMNDVRALAGDGSRMLSVTRARDIAPAREDITRAREILVSYETRIREVQTETLARLDAINGPFVPLARRQFEDGFANANDFRDRAVSMNRRGLDNTEAALDVLARSAGRWERASATEPFMFTNQADLEAYNQVATEAVSLQQEDAAFRAEFDRYLAERERMTGQTAPSP